MRPCGSEISRAGPGWVSRSSSVRAIVLAPIAFRLPLDIQSVRITHTHCMDVKRTKAEQSEATRTALIAAARGLFTERGYAAVGTEEIVRAAGVTRGALYHHFSGKDDLFVAVFEEVEQELTQRIAEAALSAGDPYEALRIGAQAFLDSATEPAVQRIALL